MTVRELFDFLTDVTITEDNMEQYLDRMSERIRTMEPLTTEQIVADEVFKQAYIPKTLSDVRTYFYLFYVLGIFVNVIFAKRNSYCMKKLNYSPYSDLILYAFLHFWFLV